MGEIVDMMLEGVLCEGCGVYLGDEIAERGGDGYPRYCGDCSKEKPVIKNCDSCIFGKYIHRANNGHRHFFVCKAKKGKRRMVNTVEFNNMCDCQRWKSKEA